MNKCSVLVSSLAALGSCSLFSQSSLTTCEMSYQCETCEDLKITYFCQTGADESSKEASVQ